MNKLQHDDVMCIISIFTINILRSTEARWSLQAYFWCSNTCEQLSNWYI